MKFEYYGEVPYQQAWQMQQEKRDQVQGNPELAFVLGFQHPSVITLGVRGSLDVDLKGEVPKETEVISLRRGGHATAHEEGQVVIYPIFSLKQHGLGVREYVDKLTKTTQETLSSYGIQSQQKCNDPGLYTHLGKIAFFGVQIQKSVCFHGVSINISNDHSTFQYIKSCGVQNESFDRVKNYSNVTAEAFYQNWCETFSAYLKV